MKNEINANDIITIGVVVLNYKNFHETIECVNSLLQQIDVSLEIVIVENGSCNESYDELKRIFEGVDNVRIIENECNEGYARGNNVGIHYLLRKGIKDIFIANSDLLFIHPYTMSQIGNAYESGIGLINPMICNPNGEVDQRVAYNKRFLYLRMLKKFFQWYIRARVPRAVDNGNEENNIEEIKRIEGTQYGRYIVAGSGYLLTRDFFDKYRGLYPGTFLYCEEWATIILLHKAGLRTKVASTNAIIHKGGASTPDNIKTMSKERRQICLNSWKAVFLLAIGLRK